MSSWYIIFLIFKTSMFLLFKVCVLKVGNSWLWFYFQSENLSSYFEYLFVLNSVTNILWINICITCFMPLFSFHYLLLFGLNFFIILINLLVVHSLFLEIITIFILKLLVSNTNWYFYIVTGPWDVWALPLMFMLSCILILHKYKIPQDRISSNIGVFFM